MQDLQLIGVHEDGEHLLLSGPDDERFQMPVDDALRAAIRRDRPHLGQQTEVDSGLRPRDVQALIRAGASTEEAASRAGWSVEKVRRYEGPILAEREHVAGLAQRARLRSRTGVSHGGGATTLSVRVTERLKERDVEVTDADWDSWRTEGRPWTVVLTFAAGGRQRQASWTYDLADRTVSAVDDEARWLSEEVQEAKGPIPAPRHRPVSGRNSRVYDLEADGGLRPAAGEEHHEDPLDLMTAMRKRSTARDRRRSGGRTTSGGSPQAATGTTGPRDHAAEQALPPPPQHHLAPDPEMTTPAAEAGVPTDPSKAAHHTRAGHPESEPVPPALEHPDERFPVNDSEPDSSRPTDSAPTDSRSRDLTPDEALPDDSGTGDQAAAGSPGDTGERAHGPLEKSARLGQSKARPKRPAREAARKTGRPSVPAWDEIMFGSKSGGDRSS
jgi:hypothetical protein